MWRVWGEERVVYRVLVGNLRESGQWEDTDVDGIILRWIFRKFEGWGLDGVGSG
jgi:hypothetical protein